MQVIKTIKVKSFADIKNIDNDDSFKYTILRQLNHGGYVEFENEFINVEFHYCEKTNLYSVIEGYDELVKTSNYDRAFDVFRKSLELHFIN